MRWYGCPVVLMTLSSTWPAVSSMISRDKLPWRKKLRVGLTDTIAISPGSSMAPRIRRCSTLLTRHSCPKGYPGPPVPYYCFKSGGTKSLNGRLSRFHSRSASWGAPSSTASSWKTSRQTRMSLAPTKTSLETSFAATCPTGPSMTMAPCSLGLAQTRDGSRECWRAWRAW